MQGAQEAIQEAPESPREAMQEATQEVLQKATTDTVRTTNSRTMGPKIHKVPYWYFDGCCVKLLLRC